MLWLPMAMVAHADCSRGSLSVSPPIGSALPATSQLVVHAYGADRDRIVGPDAEALSLVSGGERIELRVIETHTGSFNDSQVVAQAVRPPDPGHRWTLHAGEHPVVVWTEEGGVDAGWTFAESTSQPPTWRAVPQVVHKDRTRFGCGPSVHVAVSVSTHHARWVEATVWPVSGGPTASMRLPIVDDQIAVGHGMCSGEFTLREGTEYFARLVAISGDGERAEADDSPIRFVAP